MRLITILGFAVVILLAGNTPAQVTTIKGNVCSSSHSGDETAGFISLRVGAQVIAFDHRFSPNLGDILGKSKRQKEAFIRENTTKYFPTGKSVDERIGAELIVKYKKRNGRNLATSITSTGRRKKTISCSN